MIVHFIPLIIRRTYRYLLLTFMSITIGAFLFGAIISLSRSITAYYTEQGQTLVGGDIILSDNSPLATETWLLAELRSTTIQSQESDLQVVFSNAKSDTTATASLRAVDSLFPLYGTVKTAPSEFSLEPKTIYAEQGFLDAIGANIGDTVTLGKSEFLVKWIIEELSDASFLGISFAPTVLMSLDDLASSGLDLSQSRTTYKIKLKSNPDKALGKDQIEQIREYARANKWRFDDASNGPNNFVRGLASVTTFIGIITSVALFLIVVNIIANLTYFITKFRKTIALLMTFGATGKQIQTIYIGILAIVGGIAGAIGSLLGAIGANIWLSYLATYFVVGTIPATPLASVTLYGGAIGLVMMIGSAFPFFRQLRDITPKAMLANTASGESRFTLAKILPYLPIPLVIAAFLYLLTDRISLVLWSVGGLFAIFGLCMAIAYILIRFFHRIRSRFWFIARSSISSLAWRGTETIIIFASLMTAFFGVSVVSVIGDTIVANIESNISEKAPALYLVDITTSQLPKVREIAGSSFQEYPIIRGRLLSVNDRDMTELDDPGLTREFNMTYRPDLILQEEIVAGTWHGDSAKWSVSVEQSFAEEAQIKLWDTVKVFIQWLEKKATVTSIRVTDQSSGTPFFFLVFSPDVLSEFPASYFWTVAADSDIKKIQQDVGKEFPNILPIETQKITGIVNELLATIIRVVKIASIPSIVLGLLLIFVMTLQSLYERKSDVLVLRAFGTGKNALFMLFIIELTSIIILASVLSYILSHVVSYVLNISIFDFKTFILSTSPLSLYLGVFVCVFIFAWLIARTLVNTPLRKLLAEK